MGEVHSEETRNISTMPENKAAEYLDQLVRSLKNKDGSDYNASSLKTINSNLARFIINEFNIYIKLKPEFSSVKKILNRKMEASARAGQVPGLHASKPVPKKDLAKLINTGLMFISTPKALTTL